MVDTKRDASVSGNLATASLEIGGRAFGVMLYIKMNNVDSGERFKGLGNG